MRKFFKFIFILLISSCSFQRIPPEVWSQIETEDDNICIADGIQYDSPKTRTTYWQCRIRVVNQRILNQENFGTELLTQGELKKMRKAMVNKLKVESERVRFDIEVDSDEKDHNFCVLKGQKMAKQGQSFDYFKCRDEILFRKQKSGEIRTDFLTNDQIFDSLIPQNPEKTVIDINGRCIKFISNDTRYKKCLSELVDINSCESNILKQIRSKNLIDEMYCLQRSVQKYPDSLALFNASDSTAIPGPRIDKFDLIDLRDEEYNSCKNERKTKLSEYKFYLESECKKLHK